MGIFNPNKRPTKAKSCLQIFKAISYKRRLYIFLPYIHKIGSMINNLQGGKYVIRVNI